MEAIGSRRQSDWQQAHLNGFAWIANGKEVAANRRKKVKRRPLIDFKVKAIRKRIEVRR
jgi:hypothetical protein